MPETTRTNKSVVYATRGSLVAADSIVLVLTWIKTFNNWNRSRKLNLRLSVSTCLLRDGKSMDYSVCMLMLTYRATVRDVVFHVSPTLLRCKCTGAAIALLMLNLRVQGSAGNEHSTNVDI